MYFKLKLWPIKGSDIVWDLFAIDLPLMISVEVLQALVYFPNEGEMNKIHGVENIILLVDNILTNNINLARLDAGSDWNMVTV